MAISKFLLAKFEPDFDYGFVKATFAQIFYYSRRIGGLRNCVKVFQRKKIPKKDKIGLS